MADEQQQKTAPAGAPVEDGPWAKGCDSWSEPTVVKKEFYGWSVNLSNRGGVIRTRPGFSCIPVTIGNSVPLKGLARGMTVFTNVNGIPNLVVAIGNSIYYLPYPFKGVWHKINPLRFNGTGPVTFVRCIVSVTEDKKGNLTDIDPYPVLIIQDGITRAGFWKQGQNARHLDPAKKDPFDGPSETPIGLWGAWSGNRYWVSNGSRLRASNLLNPLKFTEENLLEEGGFLQLPARITGVANTFDFQSLLVYTDLTTSTILSSLTDRTQWALTPGFQRVVFDGIGCAGGNAIATQWGVKWWYTHDGLIGLDEAIRTYERNKVAYHDREMQWSKENIARPFEPKIAMGSFENLLFVSVPSGHKLNQHTWVMDEAPLDNMTYWGYFGLPAWSGIWEGINPVAWFTADVKGLKRTFCLSQDSIGSNHVWEVCTGARMDKAVDGDLHTVIKEIDCMLETKLLGYDGNYKFIRFAEIYVENLEGEIDIKVSYQGRRGGWKQVMSKHIIATDFIMRNPSTVITVGTPPASNNGAFLFDPLRPQQRAVRTISEAKTFTAVPQSGDDDYSGVQTAANAPFPRQKDYAFALKVEWTGRMSITSIRVYFDPDDQETEGVVENDEETDRTVDVNGLNMIAPTQHTAYVIDPLSQDFQSHVITGSPPTWIDPQYSTMGN